MKWLIASCVAFSFLCSLSLIAAPADTIKDNATGITFPSAVAFKIGGQEYNLQATGVATRKKLFVKVYSIAHYLQGAASLPSGDPLQAILNSDRAKQFTIKWDHDVPGAKVQETYRESFGKVFSAAEQKQLKSQIDAYIALFVRDVKKGDEHVLRWIPGGRIEVIFNEKTLGTVASNEFARGLWSVWLGDHSVVDRNSFVSLLK